MELPSVAQVIETLELVLSKVITGVAQGAGSRVSEATSVSTMP